MSVSDQQIYRKMNLTFNVDLTLYHIHALADRSPLKEIYITVAYQNQETRLSLHCSVALKIPIYNPVNHLQE